MPRVTTVLFACGALSLGVALFGVPGLAESRAPQAVVAEGRFRTADGEGAAFGRIRASGRYEITEDAVTVRFTLTDRARDGWTAGVQFATSEAWDEQHSPVYHAYGDPAAPSPGALRGPRVPEAKPEGRPGCHGCRVIEARKRKRADPLVDEAVSYRYPKTFTSSYTEGLWVREVLVKKDGRRTLLRPGRTVAVYRAPVGTVHPSVQRSARLSPGSRFAADPEDPPGPSGPGGQGGQGGPSGEGPGPEEQQGTVLFSAKQLAKGARVKAEPWGEATRAAGGRGDGRRARLLLRIRDLQADRRLAGVIVTFTDEDGRRVDTWTFWNSRDSVGRWTSRMAVNKLSGHLFYRPCVGTQSHIDGEWAYEPVSCGDTTRIY
ncbi:hypothetical protein GCM10022221_56420 [Actinocorallia aurea]